MQLLVWIRYIDDIFFIWTHGEEELNIFLKSLNEFDACINVTYESNKENITFLDIKIGLRNTKVITYTLNLLTVVNIHIIFLLIHTTLKSQLSLFCELAGYVDQRRILKIITKKWNRGSGKGSTQRTWLVLKREKLSFPKSNDKNHNMKGILLVVTYHRLLKSLNASIDKNLNILYMDTMSAGYLPRDLWFHFVVLLN